MNDIVKNIISRDNSVAIIGFYEGTAGQIYEWIKEQYHIACFVNHNEEKIEYIKRDSSQFEYPIDNYYKQIPMISSKNYFYILKKLNIRKVVITISDKKERYEAIKLAKENGMEVLTVIHPSVLLLDMSKIGTGVILHAGVIIGYKAEIKDGTIINSGTIVEHHSIVNECVTIDPGVVIAGNVFIEKFVQIHASSTIINKIRIGENAIIGAGTTVIRNIEPNTVNVGVPSRVIRKNNG